MLAGVVIVLVIAIAFRSLRLGLISIIPNVLPLAAAAALRATMDVSLDIASACSFAICLGIAVDDTIHFMTRFQHECAGGHDAPTAIRRTFVTVGTALVMTTVVMVAGFASVMTSQLPTHTLFAAMAITTIGIALPADLFILPAILCCFPGKDATSREIEPPHDEAT
jgi:predicted RND superfamily exporter protein